MFDIGWSELVAIGVVALIVIGPKELPTVLRTAGQWMGKIKRMASEFQGQFQEALREAEVADLKEHATDLQESLKSITTYDPLADADKEKTESEKEAEHATDWDEPAFETPEHTEPAVAGAEEAHLEPVAVAEAAPENLPVPKPETLPEPLPATPVAVVEAAPVAEIAEIKPQPEPAAPAPTDEMAETPPPKQAGGSA